MSNDARSEFKWNNSDSFPWVTYVYFETRNQTVQLRFTFAALERLVQNAPESKVSKGALSFLAGVPKAQRLSSIRRFANEKNDDALTKVLIILTVVGFEYESVRGLMGKQVLKGARPGPVSTHELIQKGVNSLASSMQPTRGVIDLTDAEKIEAAMNRDSGSYWWKGSGKGWDGQWHRS